MIRAAPPGDEGEARKQRVFDFLEANRERIILQSRRALLEALLCSGSATADDVRDVVEIPPGVSPKLFGAVPTALAKAGIIVADGFQKTCRPLAHARPLTLWRLADRAKAQQWLADHPLRE